MVKKFLVSLLTVNGTTKNIIIEANSHKEAQELITERYPAYETTRITSKDRDINYFSTVQKMRKEKK